MAGASPDALTSAAALANRLASRSQSATTFTPGILSKFFKSYDPRLPTPITATRMVLFGDWAASSAGIAAAVFRTSRREYMLPVSCILEASIQIRKFEARDLERVLAIERDSFAGEAWSQRLF